MIKVFVVAMEVRYANLLPKHLPGARWLADSFQQLSLQGLHLSPHPGTRLSQVTSLITEPSKDTRARHVLPVMGHL